MDRPHTVPSTFDVIGQCYDSACFIKINRNYVIFVALFFRCRHDSISRHFFVSRAYGGCSVDSGWMVVVDYGNNGGCSWDTWWTRPFFLASAASTYQTWNSGEKRNTFEELSHHLPSGPR